MFESKKGKKLRGQHFPLVILKNWGGWQPNHWRLLLFLSTEWLPWIYKCETMYTDHAPCPANELLLSQVRAQTGPRRMPSWRQQYREIYETSWPRATSYFRDFNRHGYQTRTPTAPTRYQNLLQPRPKHLNPSYIPKHLNLCNSKGLKSFKFKVQAYDKRKVVF